MADEMQNRLDAAREAVAKAYKAMQGDDPQKMADIASELVSRLYGIGCQIPELQYDAEWKEAEYKSALAKTHLDEKAAGQTDKVAEAKARVSNAEAYREYLLALKVYRLVKLAHDDIQTVLDVLRTNISIKKKQMERI